MPTHLRLPLLLQLALGGVYAARKTKKIFILFFSGLLLPLSTVDSNRQQMNIQTSNG
jgi:hypothetical protein